ncbi:Cyclic nucleotide-binding domain [Popillia japonica]|uniref:Cyclic nucleotide-binding domain n=1 Tax=Popillia japonica TaxID=7064 RepID=A0AAW1JJL2_POPJA
MLYRKRIQYAKWATSDEVPKYDIAVEGSEKATTVMKLKNQWKAISSFQSKGRKQDIDWSKIDRSFSSNYLNTLVITDSMGLKRKMICLSTECPFVMDPDSSFKRFLNYLITAAAVIQILILPYVMFFLSAISSRLLRLMVIIDMLYWLDIYLKLSTAVKVSNTITLVRPRDIIQYQFKQNSFILDIISAFPLYYILVFLNIRSQLVRLSSILRLLRFAEIFKLISEKEKDLTIDSIYVRGIKYLAVYLHEYSGLYLVLHVDTYQHQDEITMFKVIMKRRFVHKELKQRLLKILEFNWLFNEGAEIQGKRGILSEASREIRTEIINERFISCFKLVPLLKDLPEELLNKLSLQAEVIILPPDTYVQNVNVMSHNLYIILRGYCEMNSMLPGDAEREAKIILKRGDILAVIETLHRIRIFGSIVSITAIELLSINYEAFIDIFQSYRSEYLFLQNALKYHMSQFESILLRKGCRLPEMKTTECSLGRVKTFRYLANLTKNKKQRRRQHDSSDEAFKSLGPWMFLRFFLLKKTINPKGIFFIVWEVIRCSCVLMEVVISVMHLSFPLSLEIKQIVLIFRAVGLIDMYIRLHCQYYNKHGIIVKHQLYTAQNYIKTSFIIDFIANLTLDWIWGLDISGRGKSTQASIIVRLLLRPLALYRVFEGITFLQDILDWSSASTILKIKTAIIVFVILGFLSNVLMITTCKFDSNYETCTEAQYINTSVFANSTNTLAVFLKALFFNVESLTHSVSGVFGVENNKEIVYFIVIQCILYCLRCIILAIYTSTGIGGNVNLSTHQARMKQFLSFAKDLLLEETLTQSVVQHYEHVWKATLGTSISIISSKFNLYLRIQFVCFLYETSLRNTRLFAYAPPAIIQRLAPSLNEVHFKRGGIIIRINDVQKYLYFVYKGEVDIIVADTVLTTLGVGGVFGCFHKNGIFRQTFTAVGKTHTILLTLNSIKLNEIMQEWDDKQSEEALRQIRLLNVEYMVSLSSTGSFSTNLADRRISESRYDKVVERVNNYINVEGFWYWLFDYMLNVHCAAITSIANMAFICIYLNREILLGFHIAYVDPNTGILELRSRKIVTRYLTTEFALDLFSCFPIEFLVQFVIPKFTKLSTFNRVFRFLLMSKYYRTCKQKLILSKHLRWSYLIYWSMIRLQLIASIWFIVACLHTCYHVTDRIGRPIAVSNSSDSALVGYTYTINILSTTGLRETIPYNMKQLGVSIFMALFAQIMIASMASGLANMVIIDQNTMANFEHKITKMKIYLTCFQTCYLDRENS